MKQATERLLALDAFRGATLFAMVWVNMPGSWAQVPTWLEHSTWDGMRLPDFIFPFFLWIVGASLAFSLGSFRSDQKPQALIKLLKRSAILIFLGWLVHVFPFAQWSSWFLGQSPLEQTVWPSRIPGVLQRIGLCIMLAAPIVLYLKPKGIAWSTLGLLALYPALLYLYAPQAPFALENNAVGWLDQKILGKEHLYDSKNGFDPEGLLSTLGALSNVLIGYLAGLKLRQSRTQGLGSWFYLGLSMSLCALCLQLWIPLNKNLWSTSFVLLSSGVAIWVLAFMIWCLDVKKWQGPWTTPFIALGRNALLAYMLSEAWTMFLWQGIILPDGQGSWCDGYRGLYQILCVPIAGEFWGSMLFSALHLGVLCALMLWLHKKKIVLKI